MSSRHDRSNSRRASPEHDWRKRPRTLASQESAFEATGQKRQYRGPQAPRRVQMSAEEERQVQEWVTGEDRFALKQAKKGAMIRVKEGRAKPVDWLAMNLRIVDEDKDVYDEDISTEVEIPVPYTVIEKLGLAELEALQKEIKKFASLERRGSNYDYWEAMDLLCQDAAVRLRSGTAHSRAVHAVSDDIEAILKDKDYDELVALEDRVERLLAGDSAVDVDFWTDLKKELLLRKAKAKTKRIHDSVIRDRVAQLVKAQAVQARLAVAGLPKTEEKDVEYVPGMDAVETEANDKALEADKFQSKLENVKRTGYVPMVHKKAESRPEEPKDLAEQLYAKVAAKANDENEEVFNEEEELGSSELLKPRYFNRVQMGYDWNKYNQTHYSLDNPPPKVVQGYKFNIFYPELIGTAKAPTYKIVREGGRRRGESFAGPGEADTCVIKFIAGPPYQDIAFRILDREWEYSSKYDNGFKSSFDKGVLQLHFRFKKVFYRK